MLDPNRIQILKLHKSWADRLTMLWQLIALLLFGVIYFLFDQAGMSADERAGAFVLLAVMILIAAIWQATGLGIARIHMLMKGIDLKSPARPEQTG
jgi:hypothetical protein